MYSPLFTRILKEDLGKNVPDWTNKLLYQMNTMTDYLKTAFNKSITIQDNLINSFNTQTLISTGVPATDTLSFTVKLPPGYQPKGVLIINCVDNSGTIVGNPVWCEMTPGLQNGAINIRAIYGLTAGHTYSITFLVL